MCTPSRNTDIISSDNHFSAAGFCRRCNRVHGLFPGAARNHCLDLMDYFERQQTIDLEPDADPDPHLSTDYLFGPARGKMFGVLECRDHHGSTVILKAFSGQYNGIWQVTGWAPPLFDLTEFSRVNDSGERAIKALGRQLEILQPHSREWLELKKHRRAQSRELMEKLHTIYRLTNFHGQTTSLFSAYIDSGGIPTGTGDCCAPKLLHQAATLMLTPLSIAEFFWGKSNRSNSRHHGKFYPSCREKCQPILGHLLCGATSDDGT